MVKATAKLAPTMVSALLKAGEKGSYADGGNLYLQVAGPGRRSWIFRYAEKGSGAKGSKTRTHWLGLGPTHSVGLSQARDKAKLLRLEILAGIDPAKNAKRQKPLRKAPSPSPKALMFLILTVTRSAEAREACWGEIDLDAALWTVSAARMKAKREHRIPLPDMAVTILKTIRPEKPARNALVFPGAKQAKPLSDVALAKLLPAGITCHGFRSSFRTLAGETTDYAREVVEMALAHRLGDSVEQAYARGDLFERRRKLMGAWASHCAYGAVPANADDNGASSHHES